MDYVNNLFNNAEFPNLGGGAAGGTSDLNKILYIPDIDTTQKIDTSSTNCQNCNKPAQEVSQPRIPEVTRPVITRPVITQPPVVIE